MLPVGFTDYYSFWSLVSYFWSIKGFSTIINGYLPNKAESQSSHFKRSYIIFLSVLQYICIVSALFSLEMWGFLETKPTS